MMKRSTMLTAILTALMLALHTASVHAGGGPIGIEPFLDILKNIFYFNFFIALVMLFNKATRKALVKCLFITLLFIGPFLFSYIFRIGLINDSVIIIYGMAICSPFVFFISSAIFLLTMFFKFISGGDESSSKNTETHASNPPTP